MSGDQRILALIPARGGSKGVPRKNIREVGGKPLLHYTLEFALESGMFDTVCVSSDDKDIIRISNEFNRHNGDLAPFVRPDNLAYDKSPTLPVIKHALSFYSKERLKEFDSVALLQPTVPFRSKELMRRCIEKFVSENLSAVISMRQVPHHFNPHWIFEENSDGLAKVVTGENEPITRRQDLSKAYYRDGSVYLTKVESILNGSLYGDKTGLVENEDSPYFNIDTMDDWRSLEMELESEARISGLID